MILYQTNVWREQLAHDATRKYLTLAMEKACWARQALQSVITVGVHMELAPVYTAQP